LIPHCVPKNDADVGRYSVDILQPIRTVFYRNVAERIICEVVINFPTSLNLMPLHFLRKHELRKLRRFTHAVLMDRKNA